VRLLFTCRPAMGHFQPLLPLAKVAQRLGHDVAFAAGEPILTGAMAAGFVCFAAGLSEAESRARSARLGVVFRDLPPKEMRPFAFGKWFSGVEAPPRLFDLDRICAEFHPDVVVHGVAELAAPLAATRAGLPWVTVGFGPLLPPEIATLAGEGVRPMWEARGIPMPPWGGLYKHLYVDPFPPALQIPAIGELPARVGIRPMAGTVDVDASTANTGRNIYVTFGTLWNNGPAAVNLMRVAIIGSAQIGREVIVTVGDDTDPAVLGPLPLNVQVHRFVPQDQLLPTCACVVAHAGAGTLLGALAWGLPLLLLPQFADQFYNADQATLAGVALALRPTDATIEAIAHNVRRLIDEPPFTQRALAVRAELAGMPTVDAALGRIVALGAR
jgi:UDP:flavonoid glycosyltransferase YjiC (YdhE family)